MRLRQRMPWRKVRHDLWTDAAALELGGVALALRVLLEAHGTASSEQTVDGAPLETAGWMLTPAGEPCSARALARLSQFDLAAVEQALLELQAVKVAVRSDTGAWGVTGWSDRQWDDSAERKRRQRDRERDNAVTVTTAVTDQSRECPPPERDGEEDKDPEGTQEQPRAEPLHQPPRSPQAESGTGSRREIPLALTPAAPASKPARARRPDPSASAAALKVWSGFQALRIELGLLEAGTVRREPAAAQARELETGLKRAGGADPLLTALRRQAESLRRQAEREGVPVVMCRGAEFFRLSTICGATRLAELLDAVDLDHRRPATPARASPGRSRPAPPQNPGSLPPDVPSDFGDATT